MFEVAFGDRMDVSIFSLSLSHEILLCSMSLHKSGGRGILLTEKISLTTLVHRNFGMPSRISPSGAIERMYAHDPI